MPAANSPAIAKQTRGRPAQLNHSAPARRDLKVSLAASPAHAEGRQTVSEVERVDLHLHLLKQQADAGDIVLLYDDKSEALTYPDLARAWAKSGAGSRVLARIIHEGRRTSSKALKLLLILKSPENSCKLGRMLECVGISEVYLFVVGVTHNTG